MSLSTMISPVSKNKLTKIDGHKYAWKREYLQEDIQKIHNDRTYESVLVDTSDCYIGYGCSVQEFHEAWLYPEGDILMCVTTSEFAGTFASHDDIRVRYYHLTPNRKWKKSKKRVSFERYDVIQY